MNTKLIVPLLGVLALSSLGGCTEQNYGALEITAMCAPTADCTFSATCSAYDMNGYLYVDLVTTGGSLIYPFQFDNERINNSSTTPGGVDTTDTNNAIIESFELSYDAPGYNLPNATSPQFIGVPAAGNAAGMIVLIPPVEAVAMEAVLPADGTEVTVHVRATGHFEDGATFETGEYLIPVTVSHDGLYTNPCPAGESVESACPQVGQSSNVTCQTSP
jgi:hypothetical protein